MNLAMEGKPWAGFALYMGSMASYGVGSFYNAATMIINPLSIARSISSIVGLTDPKNRSELVSQIAQDPFKFSVGLGSGMLGGYTAGKVIGHGLDKISEYRLNKFLEKYPADDFLPYEQQFKYPQEVTVLEDRTVLFKESVRVADDLGAGFLDSKLVSRGSWPSKGMGYRRTGEGTVQEFIPEGMGHVETWIRPITYKNIPGSKFLSGLRIDNAALFSASSPANLGLLTSIMGASSVLSTPSASKLKTETVTKQRTKVDLDINYKTWLKPVTYIDSVNVNIPGLRLDVEPTQTKTREEAILKISSFPNIADVKIEQTQDITQKTVQKQTQKQILDLDTKQTQRQKDIFTTGFGPIFQESGGKSGPLRIPNVLSQNRKRKRSRKDVFGWERREYGMRDINTLFGGGRSRKKKGKKKDDIFGGIVF